MKYVVNVEEVLSRDIIVEAENEANAESIVEGLYRSEKIVLDYHDFVGESTIKCKQICTKTKDGIELDE